MDEKAVEMAYAKNQVAKVMTFDEFVKHIADHNGVFTRGTVKGVVSDTCSCLVEQLLNGCKVQFGELGTFGISISSEGAESMEAFSAKNIKSVNILFAPGPDFENLIDRAEFQIVASRAAQAATLKAEKAGEAIVDLAAAKNKTETAGGNDNAGANPPSDNNDDTDSSSGDNGQGGSGGSDDSMD